MKVQITELSSAVFPFGLFFQVKNLFTRNFNNFGRNCEKHKHDNSIIEYFYNSGGNHILIRAKKKRTISNKMYNEACERLKCAKEKKYV